MPGLKNLYLQKLGIKGNLKPDEETLFEVQTRQLSTIPFENIDCLHHLNISLDISDLVQKLLQNNRGGYCFELNLLLLEALKELGFTIRPLLSRVMYRGTGINPQTHVFLLTEIQGRAYIVDAGFGGPGLWTPMPLEINRIDRQANGSFRIIEDKEFGHILQKENPEHNQWQNVYAFNFNLVYPADLEMSNFYTSQLPSSHFRHNLIAGLFTPEYRRTLFNQKLMTTFNNGKTESVEIPTEKELKTILNTHFNITLPEHFSFKQYWE